MLHPSRCCILHAPPFTTLYLTCSILRGAVSYMLHPSRRCILHAPSFTALFLHAPSFTVLFLHALLLSRGMYSSRRRIFALGYAKIRRAGGELLRKSSIPNTFRTLLRSHPRTKTVQRYNFFPTYARQKAYLCIFSAILADIHTSIILICAPSYTSTPLFRASLVHAPLCFVHPLCVRPSVSCVPFACTPLFRAYL